MGSFAISIFAVRLLLPLLIRRALPWQVIGAALLISAAVYCVFPLFASVTLLVALSCVLGLGLGCSQPMVMALLYNTSPPGRQGEAVGVRTTVMNASSTTLPLASGALGAAAGMGPGSGLWPRCSARAPISSTSSAHALSRSPLPAGYRARSPVPGR